jgi:ribonuclease BN (tRNA processing enzyme)
MEKSSLTCFGVGDGWPCADRNHSSFLYRFGNISILLDCGEPVSRGYKAGGSSYDAVDALFLSHLHADHFGGFFMLLQGFWLERRRKKLTVHLPGNAIKPLRALLQAAAIYEELFAFRLRFRPLRASKPVTVGGARVTPFRTTHLEGLRAKLRKGRGPKPDSFCFLLEAGGVRVGHSADLGRPEDLAPLLKKPLDLLVCEVAHFSAEEIFRYLGGRDIKRVVFVHLARPYWEDLPQTRRLAAKLLPDIPHLFARDGQVISL